MNKNWQFRVCALYLTVGLPLAASCAREANTLEDERSGSGGSSQTVAGSAAKAGTAGSSSAFGGTNGTAGKGGGGKAGADAGEGGDAPSAGTGDSGGAGGSTGVPPDVLARAAAVVHYQTDQPIASHGTIRVKLNVVNQSDDDLSMVSVKIRYWFTAEVAPELHQYYVADQLKPTQAVFVDDGANSHALLTFGAGVIKKGGDINLSEIQLQMSNNTGKFNQADDFSWDPTSTTSKPNDKITLYLADKLIWGCEPSGVCFDDDMGAGGAAGAGGMPSAGGMPGAGGEPDAGGGMPGAGGEPDAGGGVPGAGGEPDAGGMAGVGVP